MLQEIIYTSAPQGLRAGSSGFCTVAATKGMRPRMIQLLELLSSYRHAGPSAQNPDSANPVVHAHLHVSLGDQKYHLLSRIADAGLDYSRRSNLIAHHVALPAASVSEENPASVLQQTGLLRTLWKGDSKWLEPRELPSGSGKVGGICHQWQSVTGDAGWGGVLAAAAMKDRTKPAYMIFNPGAPVLELIEESLGLLPSAIRWQIPFSTYFTKLPTEATCLWRCVVEGSPEAASARRSGGLFIDLCGTLTAPPPSVWVDAARSGRTPTVQAQAAVAPASQHTAAPTRQGHPTEIPLQSARTSVLKTERHSRPTVTSTAPVQAPSVAVPPKLPTADALPGTVGWRKIVIPAAVIAVFIAIGTSAGLFMSRRSEREKQVAAIERRVDALKDQVDKLNLAKQELGEVSGNLTTWKSSVDALQETTNEVKRWVATHIAQRNETPGPGDQGSNAVDPSKIAARVAHLEQMQQNSRSDFDKAAGELGIDGERFPPADGFVLPKIERLSDQYAEDRKQFEALLTEIKRLCGPFDSEASSHERSNRGEIGLLAKEVLEEIDRSAESLRGDEKLSWTEDLVLELDKVGDPPNLDEPLKTRKTLADLDEMAVQVSRTAYAVLTDLRDEHRRLTGLLDEKMALESSIADSDRSMRGTAESLFGNLNSGILDEIHTVPASEYGEDWVAPTKIARLPLEPKWLSLKLAKVSGFELQPTAEIEPIAEDSQETIGKWPLKIADREVGRFELQDDILSFRWDEVKKLAVTSNPDRRTIANHLPRGLLSLTYKAANGESTTALLPLHSVLRSPALEVRQDAKTPLRGKFVLPYKDGTLKMRLVNGDKLSRGWKVLSGEGTEIEVALDFSSDVAQAADQDAEGHGRDRRFVLTALQEKPLPTLPSQKATLFCRIHLTGPKELRNSDTGIPHFEYQIVPSTQVRQPGNKQRVPWETFLARLEEKALTFKHLKKWVDWPEARDHLGRQAASRQDKLEDFISKEVLRFNVHVVRVVSVDGKQYEVPAYLMGD